MKNLIIVLVALLITTVLSAQPSRYWGKLKPGDYKVGYQDTITFNPSQQYQLNDYQYSVLWNDIVFYGMFA